MAEIEDLFVLLGPFEDKINDPVKIDEIDLAYKKKQLQEVEKIDKTEISGINSLFMLKSKHSNLMF